MKSQTQRIASILKRKKKIDNFSAIHSFLSLRLGARIWDLRERGWKIKTEKRKDKNTVYWLVKAGR